MVCSCWRVGIVTKLGLRCYFNGMLDVRTHDYKDAVDCLLSWKLKLNSCSLSKLPLDCIPITQCTAISSLLLQINLWAVTVYLHWGFPKLKLLFYYSLEYMIGCVAYMNDICFCVANYCYFLCIVLLFYCSLIDRYYWWCFPPA